jgi:hypothetical protein
VRSSVPPCDTKDHITPLLPTPGGTAKGIQSLISSLYYMVKSIVTFEANDNDVHSAGFCIKTFLTHLANCDQEINPSSKGPFWISSYKYPSLLNLPVHMKEYGPLKNLWEENISGEGSLG